MQVQQLSGYATMPGFAETMAGLKDIHFDLKGLTDIASRRSARGIETYVISDLGKVIGTVSMFIWPRFYGSVAHIEDVAVHPEYQGRGIGRALMEHVQQEAKKRNCYKIVLDCSEENQEFYVRLGFRCHERQMRKDL